MTATANDDDARLAFLTRLAGSSDPTLRAQAQAELLKVGPKGYEHGWRFVGPGGGRPKPSTLARVLHRIKPGDRTVAENRHNQAVVADPQATNVVAHQLRRAQPLHTGREYTAGQWEPVDAPDVQAPAAGIDRDTFVGNYRNYLSPETHDTDLLDYFNNLTPQEQARHANDAYDAVTAASDAIGLGPGRRQHILVNGPHTIRAYTEPAAARLPEIAAHVDRLLATNPPDGPVSLVINPSMGGPLGLARRGGSDFDLSDFLFQPGLHEANRQAADDDWFMPMAAAVEKWQYVLAHEWGHLIDRRPAEDLHPVLEAARDVRWHRRGSGANRYARSNSGTVEMYADAFAEWFLSGGKTQNEIARTFARKYGWQT